MEPFRVGTDRLPVYIRVGTDRLRVGTDRLRVGMDRLRVGTDRLTDLLEPFCAEPFLSKHTRMNSSKRQPLFPFIRNMKNS